VGNANPKFDIQSGFVVTTVFHEVYNIILTTATRDIEQMVYEMSRLENPLNNIEIPRTAYITKTTLASFWIAHVDKITTNNRARVISQL
jgi:hypothetical protein